MEPPGARIDRELASSETATMEIEIDEGMETIAIDECEQLLNSGGVGVLALPGTPAPILRPVNFTALEGQLVIRTGQGQILDAARRREQASFVLSSVDRFEHAGWSVIVSGKLIEAPSSDGLPGIPLRPWVRGRKDRFVALSVTTLSGRRIANEPFVDEGFQLEIGDGPD
jgi:hypothetical protein